MSTTDARILLQKSRFNLIQSAAEMDEIAVSPVNRQLINTQLEMLQQNWTKFEEEHENLCLSQSDSLSVHEYVKSRIFERCQAFYVYSRAKLLTQRDELDSIDRHSGTALSDPGMSTSLMPRSSLPRINLPTFSGDYESWRSYHDLFVSIIRDNAALSLVEKMHYLKTSLSGGAARLISNLAVSNDNFQTAWNLLVSRYENKRFLITAQLEKLTNLKPLKTKSAKGLGALLTNVSEAMGALRALGCAVHHWDPLLLHQLVRLLDPETREAWEIKLGSSPTLPTFAQFEEFLLARTKALENLSGQAAATTVSKDVFPRPLGKQHSRIAAHATKVATSRDVSGCPLCRSPHYLARCERYLAKNLHQRRDLVLNRRLCFNCLGAHTVNRCKVTTRCRKCGKKHHTTLHATTAGWTGSQQAEAVNKNKAEQPSRTPEAQSSSA